MEAPAAPTLAAAAQPVGQTRPAVARRQSSPSSPPRCLACCNRDLQARISGSLATFQDPRSKGVGARHPYRAIDAVVPFCRVHRARPVAIQPRTSHSAPHWQVCSELLNSVIAMLLVRESNGSGWSKRSQCLLCQKMAQPVRQREKVANLRRANLRRSTHASAFCMHG